MNQKNHIHTWEECVLALLIGIVGICFLVYGFPEKGNIYQLRLQGILLCAFPIAAHLAWRDYKKYHE